MTKWRVIGVKISEEEYLLLQELKKRQKIKTDSKVLKNAIKLYFQFYTGKSTFVDSALFQILKPALSYLKTDKKYLALMEDAAKKLSAEDAQRLEKGFEKYEKKIKVFKKRRKKGRPRKKPSKRGRPKS